MNNKEMKNLFKGVVLFVMVRETVRIMNIIDKEIDGMYEKKRKVKKDVK